MIKQKLLLSSSLVLLSGFCLAEAHDDDAWFKHTNVEGFISQTAIYSSDYNFLSESDDTVSLDMWEAGALLSTQVKDQLTFSTQLLGRKVSEASGNDIRIDYAFVSHPIYQNLDFTLGARIGRIRSSFGFYNETRDIPHTRTGIVMPQSVYYDMTRNSFYSADGLELFAYKDFDENRLSFQLFFSRPLADSDEVADSHLLNPEDLKGDKSILAKVAYGSEIDGFRAAFTYYRPEYDVNITLKDPSTGMTIFSDDDTSFYSETMLTSLEYNQLKWSITGEYSRHWPK